MKIEACHITMQYKQKQVLKDINFTLEGPKIIGFLGHNGAGKTTFLNLLAGLIPSTTGEFKVNGQPAFNNTAVLQEICFIAETGNFQVEMSVEQALKANQFFYPKWDRALADELVEIFALPLKTKVKNLSKGMTSALGIIVGLASQAAITIFDEPYIGMDVAARSKFYDVLLEQQEINPRLFLFSTHLIDEVSDLFEEVLILQQGEVILHTAIMDWDDTIIAIRGDKAQVEKIAQQHTIIHEHVFMKEKTIVLRLQQPLDETSSIVVERVSVQDVLVYLSNQKKEGVAV
ncbi:ABC transporter ATP-binding protein [Lysinibacillus alkalisoli]|uniref:ABC transporter ATP-binding protein n=1 Tax=Lysinibacillus alkalisoli TaxID=1911548 RepID=A0A917FZZ6_9BACI|nr:ABC transporter ATP-binding protein [Lysinibacillus alkalisoli]GGG15831.1 ABC transporter ATP-binding protein [Lysinibacillus alkalisoli]